ncbi:retropepsin-like aspartic protease family protein [Kordiimonas aestuarii]|uniref:retropepsin-like aspartic protease family protein n=1 Tax=Kordiimonas aestuarii TaxID=1005925 RepID=UPI0021D2D941|nr:TIGR02281 family clan AA aspartic protease [Kordiimonas aestuarii]
MSRDPWRVPDHENQDYLDNHNIPSTRPARWVRLVIFVLGMTMLLFGLSLAFPVDMSVDPYLVRGLIIIFIFGGAAAFWSRSSIARIAKVAGLWALIITAIAIFYLYRSDLGTRFMSAIDPMGVTVTDEGLLLHRAQDGHFWLRADVNGVPVRFMVDTGASNVVLSPDDARRVGINTGLLDFSGVASTANGKVTYARATVAQLSLGDAVFYDVPVTVNGAEMQGSLLGMTVLRNFASIEFRGNMLILRL